MSSPGPFISSSTPAVEYPDGFRARRGVNWVFLGLMYGFFYMSRYNFSAITAEMRYSRTASGSTA